MKKLLVLAGFFLTLFACSPAHAQVYDTQCPAGSSVAPNGTARNPTNDHVKQNYCIDSTGSPIVNGPVTIVGPCTGTGCAVAAAVIQSGLMAEYRILPTESPASLVDYSGNSNNATGTVDTAPTIIAGTGGVAFTGNGAIKLPSALNTALTIQVFTTANNVLGGEWALVMGNGNLSVGNNSGIVLDTNPNVTDRILGTSHPAPMWTSGASDNISTSTLNTWNGTGVVSVTYGTSFPTIKDHIYIDQTEASPYLSQANITGNRQTLGFYQLGGTAAGSGTNVQTYMTGNIYYALFYNRILTAQEIAQNAQFMINTMAARGVAITPYDNGVGAGKPNSSYFVGCCDSITSGVGLTTSFVARLTLPLAAGTAMFRTDIGVSGLTLASIASNQQNYLPLIRPNAQRTFFSLWAGTNDGSTANIIAYQYANVLRAVQPFGQTAAVTMISRGGGGDTNKNLYDAMFRSNWNQFADTLVDVAADPNLGADGASANTTYFQSGGIHPTQAASDNITTPIFNRAIARQYGAQDFSAANVYAAAALSPTATTSGTSGSVSFAATPANCLQGNVITFSGITPSGYNNSFLITGRSATATNFTPYSALGNITVNGTGVCAEQQDGDKYQILNFGAGNYTLETCVGYTGQSIYVKNINAASSTIVPFGTETIDGSSTLTIASQGIVQLQSQLVSSATGGCNWIKIN